MAEKREHVRVETALPVRYQVLADEDYDTARKRIMLQPAAAWRGQESTPGTDLDLESLTEAAALNTEGIDPATAGVLGVLDQKAIISHSSEDSVTGGLVKVQAPGHFGQAKRLLGVRH